MIVLNMTLSFLTAVGQLLIYFSVQKTSISISAKDANIARRLITVVLSDSLCWFPIGLLGLLASAGMSVSNDVNVAMAIIVVPFNSALNPCLYTFNVAMEKRRKATEARMLVQLAKRLESQRRVRHVGTMTSEVDHAAEH
nr:hypothetical protein BaRGS_023580 [Batillaria attramentaria]